MVRVLTTVKKLASSPDRLSTGTLVIVDARGHVVCSMLLKVEPEVFVTKLLDSLEQSIVVLDLQGTIIFVNESWKKFARENSGDVSKYYLGTNYLSACERASREGDHVAEEVMKAAENILSGKQETFSVEYPCNSPTRERWFELKMSGFAQNDIRYAVLSHEEITGRIQAESDLQKKEEKWRTLFQILPVGVSIIGANNEIVEFNSKLGEILNISQEGLSAKSYLRRKYVRENGSIIQPDEFPSALAMNHQRTVNDVEIGVIKENGEEIWTNVSAAPLPFPDARAVVVTSDVTPHKRAADELRQAKESVDTARNQLEAALAREQILARTDALTGINNRRQLFDVSGQLFEVAKRYQLSLSMFIFDIDHFKQINDQYGHQFGDEVLRSIAQIANHELRKSDVLGRYGGEEFMAMLPNTKVQQAKKLAERIRKKIAAHRPQAVEPMPHPVSVSFGIAGILPDDETLDEMISRADRALYRAKKAGRNRVMIFSG